MRLYTLLVISLLFFNNIPHSPRQHYVYVPIMFGNNPKHGLAWSYISRNPNTLYELNIQWYYHWSSKPIDGMDAEFIPMLWDDHIDRIDRFYQNVPANYSGYILFANEPEFVDQANMDVERVADLVDLLVESYPQAKLIGPQSHVCWYKGDLPSSMCPYGTTPSGFTVVAFIDYYISTRGVFPPITAFGLHYGDTRFWPYHLHDWFLQRYDKDVIFWYTEFNHCNLDTFPQIIYDLQHNPFIERYAFWTNLREDNICALYDFHTMDKTDLGQIYTLGELP